MSNFYLRYGKSFNKQTSRLWLLKVLWMMYVLFPFNIKGISALQSICYYTISIISVICFLYILCNSKVNKIYFLDILAYLILFLILTCLAYTIPVLKGTEDFSYFNNCVYYWGRIFILTGTTVLVDSLRKYVLLIIDAVNLYVISSLILLIPSIHRLYMKILINSSLNSNRFAELYSDDYYTRFGLQGFSGFGATIMCTISVLLGCLVLVSYVKANKKVKNINYKITLSVIGNALYGRSGLLISIVIIIFALFYIAILYKKVGLIIKFLLISIVAILVFVLCANKLQQINSFRWMFEGFFNLLNYGHFTTGSTDHLEEMYIRPNIVTVLYGDGYYTVAGHYYMMTDVGFLRPLLFGGIFMELLYYSLVLPLFHSINYYLKGTSGTYFLLASLIFIIAFEFKGETLLIFSNVLYTLVGIVLLEKQSVQIKS